MSRLRRAAEQMAETERVLGWMRDHPWTGGIDVFVPVGMYVSVPYAWASVERVCAGDTASAYPIKGAIRVPGQAWGPHGQWKFHEVAGIRFWSDDWPELLDMHPDFPSPPERSPW